MFRLSATYIRIYVGTADLVPALHRRSLVMSLFLICPLTLLQTKFHTPLDRLPLPHDVHARGRIDDRGTCSVHERSTPARQARGV